MSEKSRFLVLFAAAFALTGCTSLFSQGSSEGAPVDDDANEPTSTRNYDELEIITLLPPDAIPAIDNPLFLTAEAAEGIYEPDELVLGVAHNGEAKAYSVSHLSSHEIVNDTIGGAEIAVTW